MQISEFTLGQPHPQETPQRIQPTCLSCLSKNLPSPLLKEWKQQKKNKCYEYVMSKTHIFKKAISFPMFGYYRNQQPITTPSAKQVPP